MKKVLPWLGWGVACIAIGVLIYCVRDTMETKKQLTHIRADAEAAAAAAETQQRALEAYIAELKGKIRDLQARGTQEGKPAPVAKTPPVPALSEGEATGDDKSTEEESEAHIREKNVLRVQMGTMTDLAYKPCLDEMNLPDSERAIAREALIEFAVTRQLAQSNAMRRGDVSAADVRAERDRAMEILRGKLQGLLTADQFTLWQNYEPESARVMYEGILEGQLRTLASGLTAESLRLAKETMAEELARYLDQLENSDELYSQANFILAQSRALQDSVEQLSQALDEEQLGMIQGFVAQATAMFAALGQ